jgi:hypothetical protein
VSTGPSSMPSGSRSPGSSDRASSSSSVPEWLRGLLDDAAVFPPGNAPMSEAVAAHVAHCADWYAELIGPFVCPASRLGELRAALGELAPVGVSMVIDTGTGGVTAAAGDARADPRLVLYSVEIPLRGDDLVDTTRRAAVALQPLEDDLAAYVEVPRLPGWRDALSALSEYGLRAKFRTGGATPDAFPTEEQLAEFIVACLDNEVSFKLTAGLHHAVRHRALDGEHHGFLNVLCAVGAALDGGTAADVASVLGVRDATRLVELVDANRFASVRRWFTSFGTCSIREPLDDLVRLQLLQPPVSATCD